MEEREEVNVSPDLISSSEVGRQDMFFKGFLPWKSELMSVSVIPCILYTSQHGLMGGGQRWSCCLYMYWPKEDRRLFSMVTTVISVRRHTCSELLAPVES